MGSTVKTDGTTGTNASKEAADIHDGASAWGVLMGSRKQLASGLIVGLEGDWSRLGHKAEYTNAIEGGPYDGRPSAVLKYDTRWLSTLRGTAGWAWGKALVYGTGGAAVASEKVTRTQYQANSSPGITDPTFTEASSTTRLGYALGMGVAWQVERQWSVRAEYLHVHFPEARFTFPDARGGAQGSYSTVQGRLADNRAFMNMVRIGVTYAFAGL
jgi:opacity protein-like surface antigen